MGSPYILGALYPDSTDVYPVFTQPGGPGTQAFPAQPIGERMGLFSSSCLHWFNAWRVQFTSYVDNEDVIHQIALVQCPLCGNLQQIIDPASAIYTAPYEYILG
jgi:hypothetical protein